MRTESEFLARQSTRAKARLRQTARTLSEELLAPLQLRPLIRRRPWWWLGGATAAGFLSGLRLGRRGAKPAPGQPGSKLQQGLAYVSLRARRLLRTALGAVALANFRGAGSSPAATNDAPPVTNGHPSTAPGAVNQP